MGLAHQRSDLAQLLPVGRGFTSSPEYLKYRAEILDMRLLNSPAKIAQEAHVIMMAQAVREGRLMNVDWIFDD